MPELNHPHPVYELSLSGGCLFLSAAAATAVHDITEIFITLESKSRQTDDKYTRGWVSFLWFKNHHRTCAHASLCIHDVIYDEDLPQTSTIFDRLVVVCFFFLCCPSWKRDSDLPMKRWIYNKQRKLTSPKMLHPKTFLIFPVCLLCSFDTSTDWVEFPSIIFALWHSTINFSW